MSLPITDPNTIYAIRCSVNGRVYVGRTKNLEQRIRAHHLELQKGYKRNMRNPAFQQDYDEYGLDAFKVFVLEKDVPPDQAEDRELHWIREYQATNPKYGYNSYGADKAPTFEIADGLPPKPEQAEV